MEVDTGDAEGSESTAQEKREKTGPFNDATDTQSNARERTVHALPDGTGKAAR